MQQRWGEGVQPADGQQTSGGEEEEARGHARAEAPRSRGAGLEPGGGALLEGAGRRLGERAPGPAAPEVPRGADPREGGRQAGQQGGARGGERQEARCHSGEGGGKAEIKGCCAGGCCRRRPARGEPAGGEPAGGRWEPAPGAAGQPGGRAEPVPGAAGEPGEPGGGRGERVPGAAGAIGGRGRGRVGGRRRRRRGGSELLLIAGEVTAALAIGVHGVGCPACFQASASLVKCCLGM
mmetsp:Transcript_101077/g.263555  ORF Transcript_101077/g.263555 Transcript_101077/m.263555 type:complete len:237 (+) Transcript_101077:236-946(+)